MYEVTVVHGAGKGKVMWSAVAAISSEWWGYGGLEAEPPAGSRGRTPGQGVREASHQPKCCLPYNRRPWWSGPEIIVFVVRCLPSCSVDTEIRRFDVVSDHSAPRQAWPSVWSLPVKWLLARDLV